MRDPLALLFVVVAIPLAWSALILAVRKVFTSGITGDQVEKRIAVVMLAPVLSAVVLLGVAGMDPVPPTQFGKLLDIRVMPDPGPPPVWGVRSEDSPSPIPTLALLYAGGFCFGALRLLRAARRHRQLAACGVPHPQWLDVLLVDMQLAAFADGRGNIVLSRAFAGSVGEAQLALAVAHERAHIRRGDPRYFAALAWIEVVLWFNPFLRAQFRKCRLAAEVACDAAVISAAPGMRKAYASMIVVALQHAAGDALACAPAAISPRNLGDYGMRIKEIMSPSGRRSKRAGWAAFGLAALLAIPAGAVQLAYAQVASGSAPFMVLPLHGRISSVYGDTHSFFGKPRVHDGVDIVAQEGAPVVAPAPGRVVHASLHDGDYGVVLVIAHGNGLMTRYAHLESIEVKEGEWVKAGQLIAHVGSTGISTGPHLHLQVLRNGRSINPAEMFDLSKL